MLRCAVDVGRVGLRVLVDRLLRIDVLEHAAGTDEHEAPPALPARRVEQIGDGTHIGMHGGQRLGPRIGLVGDRRQMDAGVDGVLGRQPLDRLPIGEVAGDPGHIGPCRLRLGGPIAGTVLRDHAFARAAARHATSSRHVPWRR